LFRVFGCRCLVLLPPHEQNKLGPRVVLCVHLGISPEHRGFRCYDPKARHVRIARHVHFEENTPYYSPDTYDSEVFSSPVVTPASTPPVLSDEFPEVLFPSSDPTPIQLVEDHLSSRTSPLESSSETPYPDHIPRLPAQIHYTKRAPRTASRPALTPAPEPPADPPLRRSARIQAKHSAHAHCVVSSYSPAFQSFLAAVHSVVESKSYQQAVQYPEWRQAMVEELQAFQQTHTWDLVPCPAGVRFIGSRWVYKVKYRPDGTVERRKARLVARGFTQQHGIDYEETFAPVAQMPTVRTLLAVAAVRRWPLYQMDVKNTFLHGTLSEIVYMAPPPIYTAHPGSVCLLWRAVYGLKQAPRA